MCWKACPEQNISATFSLGDVIAEVAGCIPQTTFALVLSAVTNEQLHGAVDTRHDSHTTVVLLVHMELGAIEFDTTDASDH